jgi:hypothetical protein
VVVTSSFMLRVELLVVDDTTAFLLRFPKELPFTGMGGLVGGVLSSELASSSLSILMDRRPGVRPFFVVSWGELPSVGDLISALATRAVSRDIREVRMSSEWMDEWMRA